MAERSGSQLAADGAGVVGPRSVSGTDVRSVLPPDHELVGRYRIEQAIGRGGVASVYRVLDQQTGQRVALKHLTLEAGSSGEQAVALFRREFHTLAQLTHPGIIRVFEYGIAASGPFYTMELLDGRDLSEVAPLPFVEACRVLRDVAGTLAILHARRIVHRDLSHRNVRLTSDGRAMLIDFGAMSPMGFVPGLIGTPPFLCPEALHGEPLDQRSDLYALGALAYWVLTARHRYPAKSVQDLRVLWQNDRSVPPSAHVAGIPAALDQFVMALMQRDPRARPGSAAEVIDRLSALAPLSPVEESGVGHCYLVNPKLIEREADLERLRGALRKGLAGEGAVLLIAAGAGAGKTRLLEEAVIEAKLVGARVLHVGAQSAGREPYATARALVGQLLQDADDGEQGARPIDELSRLLATRTEPTVAAPSAAHLERSGDQRARVQAELCARLIEHAAREPLLLAVDDLHVCDELSLSLLAALGAESSRYRLVILGTLLERGAGDDSCASLRARASMTIAPKPLSAFATSLLVDSLFGNPPNAPRLAGFIHERAHGNPLQCMELARYLVDHGHARYVDGAWMLPYELPESLPRDSGDSFRARVASLPAAARELATALALLDRPAPLALCLRLSGVSDEAAFAALEPLVTSEIAVAHGGQYLLAREGIRQALLADLAEQRAALLHQRIGEVLAAQEPLDTAAQVEAGHHLMRGETKLRGLLLVERALVENDALALVGTSVVPALELALQVCLAESQPPAHATRLRARLVACAFFYDKRLLSHAGELLETLARDGGIATMAQSSVQGSADERLSGAVQEAMSRHAVTPAAQRGLPPLEALTTFGQSLAAALGVAIFGYDLTTVAQLGVAVAPFAEIDKRVPLALIYDLVATVHHAMRGQVEQAMCLRQEMLERLRDRAMYLGVGDEERSAVEATQLHAMGMWEAGFDAERPLVIADQIDALGLETYASVALQLRLVAALYRGDVHAAKAFQVQMESLVWQTGPARQTEIWLLGYLIGPHLLWGDVIALKRTVERLSRVVTGSPGYRPLLFTALGAYYRARSQHAEAKAALERALELAPRGAHAWWAPTMGYYIEVLVASGEHARALALATENFEALEHDQLAGQRFRQILLPALALAEAKLGACAPAAAKLEAAIASAASDRIPLLRLCALHEARARVAIASGDRAAFEHHAQQAFEHYRMLDNSSLIARHLELLDEAVRAGVMPRAAVEGAHYAQTGAATRTVRQRRDEDELELGRTLQGFMDL